jgi:phosphorylase kinase alpha/beta subunit
LLTFLEDKRTFHFHCLDNGLFPATSSAADQDASGYQHVWVRDNVHIAHAHYVWGDIQSASQTANSLMCFFQRQRHLMKQVIQRPEMAADPMNRPHVRFDGRCFKELDQKWPHAQNDALGYFLWFFSMLAKQHLVSFGEAELKTLADLVLYLQTINYWEDQDSGHWEETRKISASSIGAVVAGLREFAELCADQDLYSKSTLRTRGIDAGCVDDLLARGQDALNNILPYECRSCSEVSQRRYDAALLFLIYPLQVVTQEFASEILQDVKEALEGAIGIRRYLNDSYWCADYRSLFPASERTGDFSENMKARDAHIKPGEEAQWCIFDPIISCIHGLNFSNDQKAHKEGQLQAHYLNRAIGQLTADTVNTKAFQCPEAYFLENGEYVPNEHTPLQWTQANLKMALHWLKVTAL